MLNQSFEQEIIRDEFPSGIATSFDNVEPQIQQERTKLWEFDHHYHCAIIGTCLTMDEVRKLLRSFHMDINDSCSYAIHTTIVSLIAYNDFRSKKVQSYLNKKCKTAIQKSKKMNAAELMAEWKRVLNSGELIATFWAVMSHPCTNEAMKRNFYGDIHMLSHMSGASNRADLKRLKKLENEQKEFNIETHIQLTKYQKSQTENTRLQTTIQHQTEKIADLVNRVAALTNANEHLMVLNDVEKSHQLNLQVEKLNHKISFQENEIETYRNKTDQLDKWVTELNYQINSHQKTITAYKNETEHLQNMLCQNQLEDECPFKNQGLCGQCILYVGGKANLIPYYRELVEAKAGVFLHHDGGLEKNTQDLSDSLNRADLVIFPSDCISHDAYWKIKRTCKKQHKPFEYLKSPGLHSLASVLDKIIAKAEIAAINPG